MAEAYNKNIRANQDLDALMWTFEKRIEGTKYGTIVGHFAGGEFFFFSKGKELFRSSDSYQTKIFLREIYL